MATKTHGTQKLTATRLGLFVSADGITSMRERQVGSQIIRNVRVRDEDGRITAEHVTLETTGRHRHLTASAVREFDDRFADAILELQL